MPAMDNRDWNVSQTVEGRHVVGNDRMVGIVDERAVIDDVAGEKNAAIPLEKANAAR